MTRDVGAGFNLVFLHVWATILRIFLLKEFPTCRALVPAPVVALSDELSLAL